MASFYDNTLLAVVDDNANVHTLFPVTHGANVVIEPPAANVDSSTTKAETLNELVEHLKSGAFKSVATSDTFPVGSGSDTGSVNTIANTAQLGKLYSELNSNLGKIVVGKIPVNPSAEERSELNIWIEE